MFGNDIAECSSERMSTDSFFIASMCGSELIKEFDASGYSGVNGVDSENDLCIRNKVRAVFEVSASIADDADFFFMVEVNAVKN